MSIDDPVLGRVVYEDRLDCWVARVDFGPDCPVDLYLEVDTSGRLTIETSELMRRGAALLDWARRSESSCRQRAADELLECYNEDWAAEEGEEGPAQITRDEFLQRLAPQTLSLNCDGTASFCFSDGGLFAGHRITLRLREDRAIVEVGLAG